MGKGQEKDPPAETLEGVRPCNTSILAQRNALQISGLRSCAVINLYSATKPAIICESSNRSLTLNLGNALSLRAGEGGGLGGGCPEASPPGVLALQPRTGSSASRIAVSQPLVLMSSFSGVWDKGLGG